MRRLVQAQPTVPGERLEVPVRVQQWDVARDAPSRDQAINRLAHRYAVSAQGAVMTRSGERCGYASDPNLREGKKRVACSVMLPVVGDAA